MNLQLNILILAVVLIFTACGQQEETPLAREQIETDRIERVKNSTPIERQNLDNNQIANHLANLASGVPNVNDATAIVAGPYTVVAIDVDQNLDRSRVGTIKYSVTEALFHDPYGKTAVVVADPDIAERIRGMGNKISQGHPVQGVVDELAAIVGRVMPEVPVDEDPAQEPDQNKEVLDEEDKQKLENIESDQSNQHDQRLR
ncbi:YhcN/YlaJ family sporulation lipoprotein [Oceanobacillus saliphilus]|uniref:YhcN/YlaJ family sporulation lipoprotein n=1 Tax=Oceanobacillus saliphilus TaxID=2925834 RepID=UPI00201E101F|nr:YhcN/YlaJ family sporulation lipoprotein [Oceanobacillus saliphilus]